MITKVLGKTVASLATAGVLVAPLALTSSPALLNVACETNPGGIATTTTLATDLATAPYGSKNFAHVSVTAEDSSTPTGDVKIEVEDRAILFKSLDSEGDAVRLLPRGLPAGSTYNVSAIYPTTCDWSGSQSDVVTYEVVKAESTVKSEIVNARRAKFKATVAGSGGLDAERGKVDFIVKKDGNIIRRERVELVDGVAKVNMNDLRNGRYLLKVKYFGNRNFTVDAEKTRFRVG